MKGSDGQMDDGDESMIECTVKFIDIWYLPDSILVSMDLAHFKKASSKRGETGHNLLIMLESRLDNTIYRLGFAPTRRAARQLVSHKHFLVNNKIVNIPSYLLSDGDIIQVRDKSKRFAIFQDSMRRIQGDNPTPWLTIDKSKLNGIFNDFPKRDEIPEPVNEQLVVELYSK